MLQLAGHAIMMLLPGALFAHRLGVSGARLLLAMGMSISIAVGTIAGAKWFALSIPSTIGAWLALSLLVSALSVWPLHRPHAATPTRSQRRQPAENYAWWLGLAATVIAAIAYQLWAGPYVEIPADVLAHLEYTQAAWRDLEDGRFAKDAVIGIHHDKAADYWYYINALLVTLTHQAVIDSIAMTSLSNVTTFLVAVYAFAQLVFRDVDNAVRRTLLAVASTVFVALHFGTNVFAFIRYYAFAPVVINMVVFFAAMSVILAGDRRYVTPLQCGLLLVFAITAALVHRQEAIFIAVMSIGLFCYYAMVGQGRILSTDAPGEDRQPSMQTGRWAIPMPWVAAGAVTITLIAIAAAHFTRPRLDLFAPKLISAERIFPFLKHLYILNPTIQFYQTITLWGVLLYIVFALNWRRLRRYDYLTVAMVSPLLTVFNPLFTDFFLRFSAGHTLWRLCFLIPLGFVAAWWLLDRLDVLRQGSIAERGRALIGIALLGALLLPFNATYVVSEWSRAGNLAPTSPGNAQWIADLVSFLGEQPGSERIVTDPVTGYTVSALTPHRAVRKKFFTPRVNPLTADYFADAANVEAVRGALLVVNQRDGPVSDRGRRSGHWPDHILKVSRHYDPGLLAMVATDSTLFDPIWRRDGISVYRIGTNRTTSE